MDHAITVGNVLMVCGIAVALVLAGGGLLLLISILNPFSSGH
jgi:hypothetical protein